MPQDRENQRGSKSEDAGALDDLGVGGDLDSRADEPGLDDDDSRAQRDNRTGGGRQSGKIRDGEGGRRS